MASSKCRLLVDTILVVTGLVMTSFLVQPCTTPVTKPGVHFANRSNAEASAILLYPLPLRPYHPRPLPPGATIGLRPRVSDDLDDLFERDAQAAPGPRVSEGHRLLGFARVGSA